MAALLVAVAGCAQLTLPPTDYSILPCRQVIPGASRVEWISPPEARDRARLGRWCETVGPVLLLPDPAVVDAQKFDRLVVLTWNLHGGAGDLNGVIDQLRRGAFTDGEPVERFVLLLQEAYRRDVAIPSQIPPGSPAPSRIAGRASKRGPDIQHIAMENGLAVMYVPSMRNGLDAHDAEDRGNALLSTLPLSDALVVELPFERQRRAAAIVTVEGLTQNGERWRLRLANVHLDTALALGRGGPFAARRRQAEALVDALTTSPELPTVVAGDFNTWRGDGEPAVALLRRAFPETRGRSDGPTWTGPLGIHARLDHVFARGPVEVRVKRLANRFGSDHYPLLAMVDVRPTR